MQSIRNENISHFVPQELAAATPTQRNWRGILIALLVIAAVLGLIVFSIALLTPPGDGARVKGKRVQRIDVISGKYKSDPFNGTWLSGMWTISLTIKEINRRYKSGGVDSLRVTRVWADNVYDVSLPFRWRRWSLNELRPPVFYATTPLVPDPGPWSHRIRGTDEPGHETDYVIAFVLGGVGARVLIYVRRTRAAREPVPCRIHRASLEPAGAGARHRYKYCGVFRRSSCTRDSYFLLSRSYECSNPERGNKNMYTHACYDSSRIIYQIR
ncbi:Dipeptidyl aminopeptidase-like protein 6 [Eumeta japonica]|uniref:Dipeptidyl aminopeptidase-like protein 6 n=1 Tax=Eumeta variegata TaxID=151549 RepID=A0A4C1TRA0_EUMVA|nr:Dipeptidyl aminopeptidase-like protein 6 [Eumeta japonica]